MHDIESFTRSKIFKVGSVKSVYWELSLPFALLIMNLRSFWGIYLFNLWILRTRTLIYYPDVVPGNITGQNKTEMYLCAIQILLWKSTSIGILTSIYLLSNIPQVFIQFPLKSNTSMKVLLLTCTDYTFLICKSIKKSLFFIKCLIISHSMKSE